MRKMFVTVIFLEIISTSIFANTTDEKLVYKPRFGRLNPLVAVIGVNEGTEVTDYIIPYGILKMSKVAQVYSLATKVGPMKMLPKLKIQPDFSSEQFDKLVPEGADFVIVPAVRSLDSDPTLINWVKSQALKGATIVGICDGGWVLANAGLLKNKNATVHWSTFDKMKDHFPETKMIKNKRYVVDGKIVTTTGISASIPASLAIVESIAGTEKAESVASELGALDWSAEHKSENFKLKGSDILNIVYNKITFWEHKNLGLSVDENSNEISLALMADVYSRTNKVKLYTLGKENVVTLKYGLKIILDKLINEQSENDQIISTPSSSLVVPMFNDLLANIAKTYGEKIKSIVTLQMEYPNE